MNKIYLWVTLFALVLIPSTYAALRTDDYALYVYNSTGNNSTTVWDQSGNGRNLTIVGNPTFLNYAGYGYDTRGATSSNYTRRNFGEALQFGNQNNSWSVYGWFLPNSGATNIGTVYGASYSASDNRSSCQINKASTGDFSCGAYNGSAYFASKSCTITNDGNPHSFVFIWNHTSATATLYCDNSASGGTNAPGTGSAERFYIGQRTDTIEPLNGTVFWLGVHQRVLNTNEISEVQQFGYNYLNNTFYNYYVNVTIGNTIRSIPANYRGEDTHNQAGFPFYEGNGSVRNNTLDLAVLASVRLKAIRIVFDFPNICPSYTGSTYLPCNFRTDNTSNFENINLHRSIIGNNSLNGRKTYINFDGVPKWLADNSSKCTYGSFGGGEFNYTSCDASSNLILSNMFIQYLNETGCLTTYANYCVVELGRNEAYLSTGGGSGAARGTYYYRNSSVDCTQRIAGQMVEWNQTFPIVNASVGSVVEIGSGSFNFGYSSCGVTMANTFMTQHPYGGNASPAFVTTHEYSSQNPPALISDFAKAEANFTAYGWGSHWRITEYNLNNDPLNTNSPEVSKAALMSAFIYGLGNTTQQAALLYGYDNGDTYDMYSYANQLSSSSIGTFSYLMHNATKYIDDAPGTVKTCTTTNSAVTCSFVLKNSTEGVLLLSNYQNSTVLVQTINYTGNSVSAARSNTNGTALTVSGGNAYNISFGTYAIDGYNITLTASAISNISYSGTNPATTLSIVEPNNQTFSVNVTNTDNLTLTYEWLVNGTNQTANYNTQNYTFTGNYTSAGIYNITNKVYSSQNTINYTWILTVNNTVQNISYSATSPATPVTLALPSAQTFTVTVTNSDNFTLYYSWFVNGVNQTGVYGQTSATVSAPVGNYTVVNEVIASGANTLNYTWNYSVTAASVVTACSSAQIGIDGFINISRFLVVLVLAVVLTAVVSIMYSLKDGRDLSETVQLSLMNCFYAIIAVVIVTVIIAVGSSIALAAGAC